MLFNLIRDRDTRRLATQNRLWFSHVRAAIRRRTWRSAIWKSKRASAVVLLGASLGGPFLIWHVIGQFLTAACCLYLYGARSSGNKNGSGAYALRTRPTQLPPAPAARSLHQPPAAAVLQNTQAGCFLCSSTSYCSAKRALPPPPQSLVAVASRKRAQCVRR
jgi:hypothetical protein